MSLIISEAKVTPKVAVTGIIDPFGSPFAGGVAHGGNGSSLYTQ